MEPFTVSKMASWSELNRRRRGKSGRSPGVGLGGWGRVLGLAFVLLVATRLTGQTADATRVVFDNSIRAVPEESATSTSLVATAVTRRTAVITRRELKAEELAAPMDFAVSLTMRNYAELEARIGRGEVISPAEMAAKYDPAVEDYNKVADWIQSQGMTITHESTHHLAVFAEGTVSQVKAAFAVDFARVTGVDGVEYSSAITAPSVPAEVASGILGINGLQPHIRMHRNMVRPQATSSLPVDGYLTAAVVQAYNANASGLTGAGQTIAIVIDTEPSEKDVTTFWKDCGVKQSWNNITFIKVNKGELSPPEGEETLDVEWSSSMAPAAKIRLYATVDLFPLDIDLGYEQILKDLPSQPGLNQVSLSFGDTESDSGVSQMETDDEYFAELASAGGDGFCGHGRRGVAAGFHGVWIYLQQAFTGAGGESGERPECDGGGRDEFATDERKQRDQRDGVVGGGQWGERGDRRRGEPVVRAADLAGGRGGAERESGGGATGFESADAAVAGRGGDCGSGDAGIFVSGW